MHLCLVFVENIKCTVPYQDPGISRAEGDWHKHAKDLCGILISGVPLTWNIRKQVHTLKTVYAVPLNKHNFITSLLNSDLISITNEQKYALFCHSGTISEQ